MDNDNIFASGYQVFLRSADKLSAEGWCMEHGWGENQTILIETVPEDQT